MGIQSFCTTVRVAVGMGIPTGFPYGWEWELILAYGNSHRNPVGWDGNESGNPDFSSPHNIFSVIILFLTDPNYEMYQLMYYIWGNTL